MLSDLMSGICFLLLKGYFTFLSEPGRSVLLEGKEGRENEQSDQFSPAFIPSKQI